MILYFFCLIYQTSFSNVFVKNVKFWGARESYAGSSHICSYTRMISSLPASWIRFSSKRAPPKIAIHYILYALYLFSGSVSSHTSQAIPHPHSRHRIAYILPFGVTQNISKSMRAGALHTLHIPIVLFNSYTLLFDFPTRCVDDVSSLLGFPYKYTRTCVCALALYEYSCRLFSIRLFANVLNGFKIGRIVNGVFGCRHRPFST